MSLFRKKREPSQAERLAAWRLDSIPSRDFSTEVDALLAELDLDAQRERNGWVVHTAGDGLLFFGWIDEDRVLSGYAGLDDTHDPGELTALLRRNLDPWLVWFALDEGDDALGVRFKLPLDGFDRGAVLLALDTTGGLIGDDALATRARELRDPPAGEMAEQAAYALTRSALAAGLEAAGLSAQERDGIWEVEVERGVVQAIPRDTGESVLFMHELRFDDGTSDPAVLRWMLMCSDWSGARLGLAPLPGGEGAFAASSVAAADLQPQAVAWGVEQVLRLADDYDVKAGHA
jgi:hypothetical protein